MVTVKVFVTGIIVEKLASPTVNDMEYVPTSATVFVRTVKVVPE